MNDYYSAGYFLIRADNPGWDELKSDLLPDQFISLSRHFSPRLDVTWGWIPGSPQSALDFGIPPAKLDAFLAWCQADYQADMDIFSTFHSTKAARRTIERFAIDPANLHVIGAGLPRELEEKDWREPSNEHTPGIEKRIEQHLPLEPGGERLGFEVVGFEYGNFGCTWLCSNLHQAMHELFGIRPNQYGLIDHYADAKKVYDWIAEDEMQGTRAEPIPYDVWQLIDYPLTPGNS